MQAKNQTVLEGRRMVVNYMSNQAPKKTFEPTSPAKTLFVGNLAFEMSDNDLNKLFRDIKNVIDVRVAIDRRSGQPRGFAHADFVDVESATAALEMLNGKELYGRALRVDYSAPPPSRRDFGRRDQDGGAPRGERSERY
jgi:nucleolin